MATDGKTTTTTIEALNELLRGELSAVETYSQALDVLRDNAEVAADLRECQASHQERVHRLRSEIAGRGGEAASASGAWGLFAKAVEGGATIIGPKAAINALEAGEDHGLKEYKEVMTKLDVSARAVVASDLYPHQVRTHSIMSTLKHTSPGASPPLAPVG